METGIKLDVRGGSYDVELNEDNGQFSTEVNGEYLRAASVEILREKVMKATLASKLDVRFCRVNNNGEAAYGMITGIHASKRALLIRWNSGRRETIQSYSCGDMMKVLLDDDVRELRGLIKTAKEATDAVRAYRAGHALDAWEAATKAAVGEQEDEQA